MIHLLATLLILGCNGPEPKPLPKPAYEAPKIKGHAVRQGDMVAYISRPRLQKQEPGQVVVQLIDQLNDATRQRCDERAQSARIVLAVPASTDTQRAIDYLQGITGTAEIITECHREDC